MCGSDVRFYKYLSSGAAVSVLTKKQLKWTNPKLFNDPFEFPTEVAFQFDGLDVAEAILEEMVRMVYGAEEPSINVDSRFNEFGAVLMQSRRNKNKPTPKEFRVFMAGAAKEMAENYTRGKDKARDYFQTLRDNYAVLCLSKKHDDLLMWAHYAEKHSGCVLSFRCLPEKNRALCAAQKVNYQSEYPLRSSLPDYIKHVTGQTCLDDEKVYLAFALTKSDHWKYEEEWRCISLLADHKTGYDFEPIIPEELEAVYLGCMIEDSTKEQVMECLQSQFPDTHVYQARTDSHSYKLVFDKIR